MAFKQIKKLKLKKPHQWRISYISSNDKMKCRCLVKSAADAGDLRSKGLKRRVQLCLALANHTSCHGVIYEGCLLDFMSTEKLR